MMSFKTLLGAGGMVAVAMLTSACGGDAASDDSPTEANAGTGNGGPEATGGDAAAPAARTSAAVDGFDLPLEKGVFWEFAFTQQWRGALDEELTVHYELGAPVELEGKATYPVSVTYSTGNGGGSFSLAQESGAWLKHDGSWKVLFDAWNGKWPAAGGFFGKVADSGVAVAAAQQDDRGRAVYAVSWQASSAGCTMIPGYGPVCGDEDPSELAQASETWLPGVGPFHSHFLGCTSEGCIEQDYSLTASSFGAAAGLPTKPTIDGLPPVPGGGGAQ